MRLTLLVLHSLLLASLVVSCKVQPLGTLPEAIPVSNTREEIEIEVDQSLVELGDDVGLKSLKGGRDKGSLKNRNIIFLGKCPSEAAGSISQASRARLFNALYLLTDTVVSEDWFLDVQKEVGTGEKGAPFHRLTTPGLKNYILAGTTFDLALAVCIESKESVIRRTKIIEKLKAPNFAELEAKIKKKLALVSGQLDEEQSKLDQLNGKVRRAYGSWANMAQRANMSQQIRNQYNEVLALQKVLNANIEELQKHKEYYLQRLSKLKSFANPQEKVVEKELRQIVAKLVFMGIPYRLERIYSITLTGDKEDEIESKIVDSIITLLEKGY